MSKKELPCNIIKDLLPNYIEGLTSPQTSQMIKQHMESCPACSEVCNHMQTTEDLLSAGQNPGVDKNEGGIDYLKKIKKKQRTMIVSLLSAAILIFISAFYLFNVHIFSFSSDEMAVGEVYQLADGQIYYQIIMTGRMAKLNGISFRGGYTDSQGKTVTSGRTSIAGYKTQLGYTLAELWQRRNDTAEVMIYHFVYNVNITDPVDTIYFGGLKDDELMIVWQRGMDIPEATEEIEKIAGEINKKPFLKTRAD